MVCKKKNDCQPHFPFYGSDFSGFCWFNIEILIKKNSFKWIGPSVLMGGLLIREVSLSLIYNNNNGGLLAASALDSVNLNLLTKLSSGDYSKSWFSATNDKMYMMINECYHSLYDNQFCRMNSDEKSSVIYFTTCCIKILSKSHDK